jgi:DnaJ like chaperone protein
MGIWGKILGGAAGFAIGGPLGALVGAAAGHAIDVMRADRDGDDGEPSLRKQTAFAIAVIVLGAKIAKADGQVTPDEIVAFKEVFHIPPDEMKNVGRLFNQARKDSHGFEPYAKQVARMFAENPSVLEELLGGLFHIAKADGVVHPKELEYLHAVAGIFGMDDTAFDRVRAAHVGGPATDPYAILGVTRDASDDAVRSAWRKLVRENHPDTLVAQGMPQDFVDMATEKVAAINAAYDEVCKQRGIK